MTEDMMFLEEVQRIFPNVLFGLAMLRMCALLIKHRKTHLVLEMVMISG
jgi:hypothetical protein